MAKCLCALHALCRYVCAVLRAPAIHHIGRHIHGHIQHIKIRIPNSRQRINFERKKKKRKISKIHATMRVAWPLMYFLYACMINVKLYIVYKVKHSTCSLFCCSNKRMDRRQQQRQQQQQQTTKCNQIKILIKRIFHCQSYGHAQDRLPTGILLD